jgi:CBS domain-containing protein
MLKAKDIMSREVITASPGDEVFEAARKMIENRVNGLPVVDEEGKLTGIITQSDLIVQQKTLRLPSVFTILDGIVPLTSAKSLEDEIRKISALKVEEAMTDKPISVGPETDIQDIANIMVEKKFHTVPVVEEGKLLGVVGKEDVLGTLLSSGKEA